VNIRQPFTRIALLLAFSATFGVACSDDDPVGPSSSPLQGLTQQEERDSVGGSPPPPEQGGSLEPGIFRGRVLGQSEPGAGNDSLETAPRLAGVRVAAYPVLSSNNGTPSLGPEAASVVTGSDGMFQLPELPGGEYAVTFEPPAGSIYRGAWVHATAHGGSNEFPWWVVLSKK
jgi:hypothetical protein